MDKRKRILVIEDQPEVLEVMVVALAHAGFEVEGAADGNEGVRLAESGRFDLISTDVDLPGMNGFEICARLKRNSALRHTPIIFVSGRTAEADLQRGRELGAADYVAKPFDLLALVARLLSHATPVFREAGCADGTAGCAVRASRKTCEDEP